eukprot:2632779-Pleurochrysis_carterae.AAC.1
MRKNVHKLGPCHHRKFDLGVATNTYPRSAHVRCGGWRLLRTYVLSCPDSVEGNLNVTRRSDVRWMMTSNQVQISSYKALYMTIILRQGAMAVSLESEI